MISNFLAHEDIDEPANNDNFKLHTHDFYEIYMFSEGDSEHIVEGAVYSLNPMDIILLRPGEMHRVYHKSEIRYKRTVINFTEQFMEDNACLAYRNVFWERKPGDKNKIDAIVAVKSGIIDCIARIRRYSNGYERCFEPAAAAAMVELLYLLGNVSEFSTEDTADTRVRDIIAYINENYRENISLESVASHFFLSKSYLCRMFRPATGFTVGGYIRRKRLCAVRELCKEGVHIGEACNEAGFADYSTFYKAYVAENSVSPGVDLKGRKIK